MSEQNSPALNPRRIGRKIAIALAALFALLLMLLGIVSFVLSTQTGSQWALQQAEQRLANAGTPIVFEGVQGTIFRGLSFRRIDYSDEALDLQIENLRTAWNPYSLLTGQLLLSDLEISSLSIDISDQGESSKGLDIEIFANPLPMAVAIGSLRVGSLEISQARQLVTLQTISLSVQVNDAGVEVDSLQLTADELSLAGEARLSFTEGRAISALLDWRYDLRVNGVTEQYAGQMELAGDLSSIDVRHRLETPQQVQSTGRVESGLFAGEFSFELNHTADSLQLPIEVPGDYGITNVSLGTYGNLDQIDLALSSILRYESYVDIEFETEATFAGTALNVQSYSLAQGPNSVAGSAGVDWSDTLRIEGNYVLAAPAIAALVELPEAIDLSGLAGSGSFDLAVPDAEVEASLTIDALEGQIANFPMQAEGALTYSGGTLEFNQLRLATESNSLALSGSYSDVLDLQWSLSAMSLQEFVAQGRGSIEGSGSVQGDPVAPDIIGSLSGLDVAFDAFAVDQFDFDFQLAEGQVQSELTIARLNFNDGALDETLSPVVLIASGSEENHRIDVSTVSRYGDFIARLSGGIADAGRESWVGSLETATLDTPVGTWSARESTAIAISASQIDIGESCWVQLETTLCLELNRVSSDLSVTGSLENYPLSIFNAGQFLTAGASANLVRDQLLLPPQLPEGSSLSGRVDGEFSMDIPAAEDFSMDFSLTASNAVLSIQPQLDPGDVDLELEAGLQEYDLEVFELSGTSQAGGWQLNAGAGFVRSNIDDSEIGVRGEMSADIGISANNILSGTIVAGLEDLRWVQALIPELSNIGGSVNARASLAGTLSAPVVTGSIDLEDASVSIDTLGIALSDINANISSEGVDSVRLEGSAQSGSGFVNFDGEFTEPFAANTSFSARVDGENFQLAQVPNLELSVSPDVVVTIDANEIEVNGSLDVPILNLTLQELPESAVDVSRDVVIVNYPSDRPDLARSIAANESTVFDRPLIGDIDITLGEEVSFTGFGLTTRLAGGLNIQQTAGGTNRTYGELSIIDGSYEMYRQSLEINQGKLLFFGAYDNPGIDLRATRKVDNYTVGVIMNGTLKNIQSQLFSTPALPENDIIAVLVTGRPFSEVGEQDGDALLTAIANLGIERGEGLTNQVRNKLGLDVLAVDASDDIDNSVLTIGKYLTPKIFVRYGIGLFDSQSKVAVDYTISERVKFQAESGEYQSVDVIFSVER